MKRRVELFSPYFSSFLMIILMTMCVGVGWDCETVIPDEPLKPSFEPQPPSLMLKMRFLKRSGRKYEKNCSYRHGVSGGLAKKNLC